MASPSRKSEPKRLPLQRGLLRVTGDTIEGARASDAFDVVSVPGGDLAVVLLDVHARGASSSEVAEAVMRKARIGLYERTALHAIMLDLVRVLFDHPGSEVRATLFRCSAADARVEISTAGMPPVACAQPGGDLSLHASPAPALTALTTTPPPIEVVPLVWGSTWLLVSDGFTAGSNDPDAVLALATDFDLCERGLGLAGETPDALYDRLAARLSESGRFARDDATLVLVAADPHARFTSQPASTEF